MPDFAYQAIDTAGNVSSGVVSAQSTTDAALKVRALGVYPTAITAGANGKAAGNGHAAVETASASLAAPLVGGGKKVSRVQILLFTREMADLLDAGLPMDRAFSVLLEQSDSPAMRAVLTGLQGDIRAGRPLSEALARYPREFPRLYMNMVHAGEVSGQLAGVLMRLADFMEKEQVRRSQIVGALTYPMVLICVALGAVTFLLTFVIPKLQAVFEEMRAALPLPTVILLGLSGFIAHYWWAIILVVAGAVAGFRAWLATDAGRHTWDEGRLRVPLFGPLTRKIVSSRLARTLGTLLHGGVPILDAMEITAAAVGNVVAADAVAQARGGVRQGEMLHTSLARTGVFMPVVTHMAAVGEETGRLPQMLLRTADTLDFEADSTMRRMTTLVEPLVVLLMGGFVGFVVLSILLPIFKLNSTVR